MLNTRPLTQVIPLLLLVLQLALATSLHGQDPGGLFFESVDVSVANIEVVVTDTDGQPVTGLTRDDFEVFEDKQPVELTNFFAVENRTVSGSKGMPNASLGGPETRQLFLVIYVDNMNLKPISRNRAFESLRTFLRERLQEGDQVMIVNAEERLEISQKFTSDLQQIEQTIASLEKDSGRSYVRSAEKNFILRQIERARLPPRPQTDTGVTEFVAAQQIAVDILFDIRKYIDNTYAQVQGTVDVLNRFTGSLAGMPGRKAILYLSDGVPSRVGESLIQAWQNKFEFWAGDSLRDVAPEFSSLETLPRNTMLSFQRLVDQASAQKVSFYPISNPRGETSAINASASGSAAANGDGPFSTNVQVIDAFNRESPLLVMAEGTGGVAFTRSSNMADLLDHMVRDFSTFYSLGYTPLSPGDGEFHRVEVKVKRPGLKVRHVRGHREVDPAQQMENLTLSALFYDFDDNPLQASLSSYQYNETVGGKFRVPVLLRIPFNNLVLLPQQDKYLGRVMAYVVVQDAKGNLSPFQHVLLPIEVPNDRYDAAIQQDMAYRMDLVMEKGEHRVSIGIRDEIAKIQSTVYLDVRIGEGKS